MKFMLLLLDIVPVSDRTGAFAHSRGLATILANDPVGFLSVYGIGGTAVLPYYVGGPSQ